jgi:hypothetical protein
MGRGRGTGSRGGGGGGTSGQGPSHGQGSETTADGAAADYVADDEEDEELGGGKDYVLRVSALTNIRTLQRKLISVQEDVRKYTAELLRMPRDKSIESKVTENEANAYDPMDGPPCAVNDFRLYFGGPPAHVWNKEAAKVFLDSFCRKYPHHQADDVRERFKVHVQSLVRKYRKQRAIEDETISAAESASRARKNTRKGRVGLSF